MVLVKPSSLNFHISCNLGQIIPPSHKALTGSSTTTCMGACQPLREKFVSALPPVLIPPHLIAAMICCYLTAHLGSCPCSVWLIALSVEYSELATNTSNSFCYDALVTSELITNCSRLLETVPHAPIATSIINHSIGQLFPLSLQNHDFATFLVGKDTLTRFPLYLPWRHQLKDEYFGKVPYMGK